MLLTLKEIKLGFKSTLFILNETKISDLYELQKIAKISVFITKIPLIVEIELTLCNEVPMSFVNNLTDKANSHFLLQTECLYVVITKDKKYCEVCNML